MKRKTLIPIFIVAAWWPAKEGKMLPLAAPEAVLTLIEFDELQALAEALTLPEKMPKSK